jgi:hypothetical protein
MPGYFFLRGGSGGRKRRKYCRVLIEAVRAAGQYAAGLSGSVMLNVSPDGSIT